MTIATTRPTDPGEFCTAGTATAPAGGRKASGWLADDVPPAEEFNWKWKQDYLFNEFARLHGALRFDSLVDVWAASMAGWLSAGDQFTVEAETPGSGVLFGHASPAAIPNTVDYLDVKATGVDLFAINETDGLIEGYDNAGDVLVSSVAAAGALRLAVVGRVPYVIDGTNLFSLDPDDLSTGAVDTVASAGDVRIASSRSYVYTITAADVRRYPLDLASLAASVTPAVAPRDIAADRELVLITRTNNAPVQALDESALSVVWTSADLTTDAALTTPRGEQICTDGVHVYATISDTAVSTTYVACFSRADGSLTWIHRLDATTPVATAIAVDQRWVVVSVDGNLDKAIWLIDKRNGGLVSVQAWDSSPSSITLDICKALTSDGVAIYGAGHYERAGTSLNGVVRFNRGTGPEQWTLSSDSNRRQFPFPSTYFQPANY